MRPLTLIGTILILVAFTILGVFIVIPATLPSLDSAPLIRNTLQGVLCGPGESLTILYSQVLTPNGVALIGRSLYIHCENRDHQVYEVTGQDILIGIVGYLVPFLVGLIVIIVGRKQRGIT